jgi:5-methylcytosine-specific restriction endonuclease McrA
MPPAYVKTIREEILYEYAKLISRSAYKSLQRPFITDRFKKLRDGEITISGTIREWEKEQELPKQCVYCGSIRGLTTDHLIPRGRGGDESADNVVLACQSCNAKRGDKGIFEYLGLKDKDKLHRLVAGKYLKQLLTLHEQADTLDIAKDQITILCARCALPKVCEHWGTVRELTCFCLESILRHSSQGVENGDCP